MRIQLLDADLDAMKPDLSYAMLIYTLLETTMMNLDQQSDMHGASTFSAKCSFFICCTYQIISHYDLLCNKIQPVIQRTLDRKGMK